jgi:hypothetical protein
MVKLRVFALLGVLMVAGCETVAPPPPPPPPPPVIARSEIVIQAPYRAEDFAWSLAIGSARIHITTATGRSCAGNSVALTPDTPYARERIRALYGAYEFANEPVERVRSRVIANDNPDMRRFVRAGRCDANGAFSFDGLPAGAFFVITEVSDPSGPRVVMRRVITSAGRLAVVPMTTPRPY